MSESYNPNNGFSFSTYAERCIRDTPPPCACVCPCGLDIRKFIEKLQQGNTDVAYKLYRDAVLFPSIVSALCSSPCRDFCVRKKQDYSVDLISIEKFCVDQAKDRTPIRYTMPRKDGRIAIIGAGVSGLSCAMKLAARGYTVDVYEQTGVLGGVARCLIPDDVCDKDIANEMQFIQYKLHLHTRIDDLDEIESDAVYIATGEKGHDFGLSLDLNTDSLGTTCKGVFLGGMLCGMDVVGAIEHGSRVSYSIENFLKTGKMNGIASTYLKAEINQKFYDISYDNTTKPQEIHADIEEAARCYLCNCSACMDVCSMLKSFHKYPKSIASELVNTVELVQQRNRRVLSKLVNSCNLCGLCAEVCPVGIDNGRVFQEGRNSLNSIGHMPPVYHDFWMEDMYFSLSDEAYTVFRRSDVDESDVLFFPGCQLTASSPKIVKAAFEFIERISSNAAILTACCGVPAEWAGEFEVFQSVLKRLKQEWKHLGRPLVLFACTSCQKLFAEYLPEINMTSLYIWLDLHHELLPNSVFSRAISASVYDPCSSRHDSGTQQSVRNLAKMVGYELSEIDASGDYAACCGFGGHIYVPNPMLTENIARIRSGETSGKYITYCANCRDMFISSGKQSNHILEFLFPSGEDENHLSSLTERRQNRKLLKASLTSGIGFHEGDSKGSSMDILISDELEEKMDRLLLLRDDVEKTVANCEKYNEKLFDPIKGINIGYLQKRSVTVWVEYTVNSGTIELCNVYTHRMSIQSMHRCFA